MAKDGSIAPKERVNIVYKPATGDAQSEVELPLKLMMIGDYTQRADDTPVEERKPVSVDKDNFNDVMRSMQLSIDINCPNRLSGEEGEELAMSLRFESLKDFDPENVLKQVPELNQLLELRQALVALKGPLGNVPAFRKKIEATLSDEGAKEKLMSELGIGQDD
ncbi:MAG TPA: type VI secretion system contractile sheath small subunit [Gammaproteobacteria bacterium]|nr:type VI secretion system contractile sheath small subunit [Gammaproteobacteria bacterium]